MNGLSKVVVIGGTGMLGSMLVDVLSRDDQVRVYASCHNSPVPTWTPGRPEDREWKPGDVKWFRLFEHGPSLPPSIQLGEGDWILNAAGMIPHRVQGDDSLRTPWAFIEANASLPYKLAGLALEAGAHMVHFTTDCVFSGDSEVPYYEDSNHDELSTYGRTKSLGEVQVPWVTNLRCSIVGPEPGPARGQRSLLEWFLGQPQDAEVEGYANHWWNGLTTLALAEIAHGVICSGFREPGTIHVVPQDSTSKDELLRLFGVHFGRQDIRINRVWKGRNVRRKLGTAKPEANERLWKGSGGEEIPGIGDMLKELAAFNCRFRP